MYLSFISYISYITNLCSHKNSHSTFKYFSLIKKYSLIHVRVMQIEVRVCLLCGIEFI